MTFVTCLYRRSVSGIMSGIEYLASRDNPVIILLVRPASGRRRYIVTSVLIGLVHIQNDHLQLVLFTSLTKYHHVSCHLHIWRKCLWHSSTCSSRGMRWPFLCAARPSSQDNCGRCQVSHKDFPLRLDVICQFVRLLSNTGIVKIKA